MPIPSFFVHDSSASTTIHITKQHHKKHKHDWEFIWNVVQNIAIGLAALTIAILLTSH